MRAIRLVAGLLLAGSALVFVACGETTPVDFGDALPDGAVQMDQKANSFSPGELTVDVLESVYFTNSSTALHNILIAGENVSGDMERGDVFSFSFAEAGEYEILCGYHPQMKATITVE